MTAVTVLLACYGLARIKVPFGVMLPVFLAAGVWILLWPHRRRVLLLVLLLLMLLFYPRALRLARAPRVLPEVYRGELKILRQVSQDKAKGCGTFLMETKEGSRLMVFGSLDLRGIKRIHARIEPRPLEGPRNPGGFSAAAWGRGKNAYHRASLKDGGYEILEVSPLRNLVQHLEQIEDRISTHWQERLGEQGKGLLQALFWGDKKGLEAVHQMSLEASGLSHLTSVSGLHLYFMLHPIDVLIRRFPALRRRRLALGSLILVPWIVLLGFRAGIFRAVLLFAINEFTRARGFRRGGSNALAWAFFCLLYWEPCLLFDRGFQLSFLASFAILTVTPGMSEFLNRKLPALGPETNSVLAVALSVQLVMLLPQYFFFHHVNLLSLPLNIVMTVLIEGVFQLTFVHLCLAWIPILGPFVSSLLRQLIALSLDLSVVGARLPLTVMGRHLRPTVVGFAVLALTVLLLRRHRALAPRVTWRIDTVKAGAFILTAILGMQIIVWVLRPTSEIIFADVGQGDAILIRHKGNTMLVDGGVPKQAKDTLVPLLYERGISRIDVAVATHSHDDHVGGVYALERMGKVRQVIRPREEPDEKDNPYGAVFWARWASQCPVTPVMAGDHFLFSGLPVQVVAPTPEDLRGSRDKNDASLVLLLRVEDLTLCLTGDTTERVERRLAQNLPPIPVDVLKVPHHGSKTSSSEAFLALLAPRLNVVQLGVNNYGHPVPEVLERLGRYGEIFRTDHDGAILLQYQRKQWLLKTMLGGDVRRLEKEGARGQDCPRSESGD